MCHKFFLTVGPLSFSGSKTKKISSKQCLPTGMRVCVLSQSVQETSPEHFMRTRLRNNRAKLQKKERNQRIAPSSALLILPTPFFHFSSTLEFQVDMTGFVFSSSTFLMLHINSCVVLQMASEKQGLPFIPLQRAR